MSKNDDCYYFYNSTCTKGAECLYRHEPQAIGQEVVCQFWKQGRCAMPHCKFRHMEVTPRTRDEIQCFFETQPGGCLKANCVFKHTKPKDIPASASALPAERPAQSIIVNKSKMSELGLSFPIVEDDGTHTAIRRKVIASSKLVEDLQLTRPKLSVKSRLGLPRGARDVKSRLGPARTDEEEDEDIEVDVEEKSLRDSAIQSLDLRRRLDSRRNKRPLDVHSEEEMIEEYVYEIEDAEDVPDDQPKAKRLKLEVKKVKKEKKSKKKKKEKKAKKEAKRKNREPEAKGNESEEGSDHSFSDDNADLEEHVSLAHKIAALRDRDGVGERIMQKSQAKSPRKLPLVASREEKKTEDANTKAEQTEESGIVKSASTEENHKSNPPLPQASSVQDFLQEVDELLKD